jgi:hypothetical protein
MALKGHIPWNKGTKGLGGRPKGIKFSKKHKIKLSQAKIGLTGVFANNWKTGNTLDGKGYRLIYYPSHPYARNGKYVQEHKLVIEKILGRYLLPEETIHHLGIKTDNRLQMLMLFVTHSAHMRFHKNPNNVKLEEIVFDGREYECKL